MRSNVVQRRMHLLAGGLLAAGALLATSTMAQQNYPAKTITIISPFGAGAGSADSAQRYLSEEFKKRTGQGFLIDNRPGANNTIGAMALLKAPADGYTIGFTSGSFVSNPSFFKLPYKMSDFQPIIQWSIIGLALITPPSVPAKNFKEYLAWAKSRPTPINAGIIGALPKLTWRQIAQGGGFRVEEVFFKGLPDAVQATLGGFIDGYFTTLDVALSLGKDNKVKVLALGTEKRMAKFPGVETVSESIPGVTAQGWGGFIMSAQAPRQYAERINREMREIMKMPETAALWDKLGLIPASQSIEEFGALMAKEAALIARLSKEAGIEVQDIGQ